MKSGTGKLVRLRELIGKKNLENLKQQIVTEFIALLVVWFWKFKFKALNLSNLHLSFDYIWWENMETQ